MEPSVHVRYIQFIQQYYSRPVAFPAMVGPIYFPSASCTTMVTRVTEIEMELEMCMV